MTIFADHPVLLLFAVIGIGSAVGRVRLGGFSLGPAAVLFCGLAASGIDDRLVLSDDVQTLGLVLFTYTVGLAAGPAFAAGLRGRGLRSVAAVATLLCGAALVAVAAGHGVGLGQGQVAGVFAGALTNTPALGAVLDRVNATQATAAAVGYSLAYPGGVLGALFAAHLALRWRRAGSDEGTEPIEGEEDLVAWTVHIQVDGLACLDVLRNYGGGLAFGHHARGNNVDIATGDTVLEPGDLITVVGPESRLRAFTDEVGERSDHHLALDRRALNLRRFAVSSKAVAGRTLRELDLEGRFGATATRVHRGDLTLIARDELVVELGDRLRIVAPERRFEKIADYLGDSEAGLAEVEFVATAFGLVAGVLLGVVRWPGGLQLGAAGGTLIAGLVLGAIGRVRRVLFAMSHQASLTLRQLGTVVFLAAVGTRAGAAFSEAAFSWEGLRTVLLGFAITAVAMSIALITARRWCGLQGGGLAGAIAGAQTQPAVLAFAQEQTGGSDQVAVGYTSLYPAAMVLKIVAAQLLAG